MLTDPDCSSNASIADGTFGNVGNDPIEFMQYRNQRSETTYGLMLLHFIGRALTAPHLDG
jgi:hypothetical protein